MIKKEVIFLNTLSYPIDHILPEITAAVRANPAVIVQAPPGAGKTTGVPLALLEELAPRQGKIIMLEPRRIAAVAAARWMARQLGEPVGKTVGYTIRFDSRTSADTRLEVVTEGILTRRLLDDPALDGVAMIICDEFHERSLQADLALALCLDIQRGLREDLKLLVMSATLDTAPLAALLGNAPVISSPGKAFPVEDRYLPAGDRGREKPWEERLAGAVRTALADAAGDILVFLPGSGEIRRLTAELQRLLKGKEDELAVHPLYGDLPFAEQERAIRPGRKRKIVLATNIAETSLTIEGVRVVIDGGLTRRLQYDPATGMNRLLTVKTSRAAAIQRRGRAGRTAPGVCYRLYSPHDFQAMIPFSPPEILVADLASLVLELAAWGVMDPTALSWLDPPPAAAWETARQLLAQLGALDRTGAATPLGRAMSRLPLPPRLGRLLLRATEQGCPHLGADLAALLSERDILRRGFMGPAPPGAAADVSERLCLLREWRKTMGGDRGKHRPSTPLPPDSNDRAAAPHPPGVHRKDAPGSQEIGPPGAYDVIAPDFSGSKSLPHGLPAMADPWALAAAARAAEQLRGAGGGKVTARGLAPPDRDEQAIAALLLHAYPDRIAQRREEGGNRYLLSQGRGARLPPGSKLSGNAYLIAVHLDGGEKTEGMIHMAEPVAATVIRRELATRIEIRRQREWNRQERRILSMQEERLGSLLLAASPVPVTDAEAAPLLCAALRAGAAELNFRPEVRQFQGRVALMRRHFPNEDWPDLSAAALLSAPEAWLAPRLAGIRTGEQLAALDLLPALEQMLSWTQRKTIAERAPTAIPVPSGRRALLDYAASDIPVLAVKLQEMFGLAATPVVAAGRAPVLVHLLSPAGRPVQITRDLKGFWENGYPQVKKELQGRYPKHPWPDDPWHAVPTRRTKKSFHKQSGR